MSFPSPTPHDETRRLRRDLDALTNITRFNQPQQNVFSETSSQVSSSAYVVPSVQGLFAINPVIHTIHDTNQITLVSSSVIVDGSGSLLDLQVINGTINNGQIILVKPKAGKQVTLKTGGNINIGADVVILSGTVAQLQYHEDDGNKYDVVSIITGGGSGTNWSDITIDISKDMLGFNLTNLGKIGFKTTSGIQTEVDGNDWTVDFNINAEKMASISRGDEAVAAVRGIGVFELFGYPSASVPITQASTALKMVSLDNSLVLNQVISSIASDAKNLVGAQKTYSEIKTSVSNYTSGSETAKMQLGTIVLGTLNPYLTIDDNGVSIESPAPQFRVGHPSIDTDTVLNGDVQLGRTTTNTVLFFGRVNSHILPNVDDLRDLGATSLGFRDLYLADSIRYSLDPTSSFIGFSGSGNINVVTTGTNDDILISAGGSSSDVNILANSSSGTALLSGLLTLLGTTLGTTRLQSLTNTVAGGGVIKSQSSTEVGFQVSSASLSVGSVGSIEVPYISQTDSSPSDATLNSLFGNTNGCIGVLFDSDASIANAGQIFFRAGGTWYKVFGTKVT